MADLGTAYVQIVPSAKGIAGKIGEEIGGDSEKTGKSIGSKIMSGIKAAAAVAAIGKVIGDSISAGADLEQSIGGIETMFKENADQVIAYANQAYATAGLSANDYMQQVTSFSASLLQGLGGDTAAAGEIANMAMIDMADNANKFGTDIESVQAAVQGLAKGNFTMLDNLKLGFAGTKEGMVDLINASGIMEGEISSLDGVTFDQMLLAIHEVQGQLGITGTTAAEAASTFSGSLSMLKSSWTNVLAALSTGENLDQAMEGLTQSMMAFGSNAVRLFGNIVKQLPQVLINILVEMIPNIIPFAVDMVKSFATAIKDNWPAIKAAFATMWEQIKTAFKSIDWKGLGKNIIDGIVNGLKAAGQLLINFLKNLARKALDGVKKLLGIGSPSKVFADEVGRWIPAGIAVGIEGNEQQLDSAVQSAVDSAYSGLVLPSPLFSAVQRALNPQAAQPVEVTVVLDGDARKLFRMVRTENTTQTRRTNYNALAAARG